VNANGVRARVGKTARGWAGPRLPHTQGPGERRSRLQGSEALGQGGVSLLGPCEVPQGTCWLLCALFWVQSGEEEPPSSWNRENSIQSDYVMGLIMRNWLM
jgi:hypothetical protein